MPVPGPAALGRGVVINAGDGIPAPWAAAEVVVVDDAALVAPRQTVERLHQGWASRQPIVVELAVDPGRFREPVSIGGDVWRLGPDAEPWFDRLHFLVWNNTYDARGGNLVWWWGRKAARAGAVETPDGPADVTLDDGTHVWVDGGPRSPWSSADLDGFSVVHHESVELGFVSAAPEADADLEPTDLPPAPTADRAGGVGLGGLAEDQRRAVLHRSGPARIIAPAGSGKTRVLTERLRLLLGPRRWEPQTVLAVAYNKQAQLELERRTSEFRPRVRTLNALGYWVIGQHQGRTPNLADERDCRNLVESLLPGRRPRRANTDPIGPYLEALGLVRLGLRDPADVEAERDDVDGLADLIGPYRRRLADGGAVDFDEQIYGAIEVLLRDGPFRRAMQQRCRHLLVDEFQDLTPAHVLLLRLLALPALDVYGVGDDDQTIYGHAGADPAFLIDYRALFPAAAEHALTVNYRCPVQVIDGARHLLGYNRRRVTKEIEPGPDADRADDALRILSHDTDGAAAAAVEVVEGWIGEGAAAAEVAVLARVNSLLLAPQVALSAAGVPLNSVLEPTVLERTGMRAALAYLRLAAEPARMAAADIVEIMRRPSRGLHPAFPDRLARRGSWSPDSLASLADQVPDKDAAKVLRLADDLRAVADAARAGTTRAVLEVVRDEIGLGAAMGMLDRTGGGQGSSHLDDLEGLLGVADLHPSIAGFEPWLRSLFGRERDPDGVVLSTIHRVKGREWDRVVVFGVSDGIVPHRLSEDREEERRVLHVGITRGRSRVAVLADRSRRSPFLAELAGTAPHRPVARTEARPARGPVEPVFKKPARAAAGAVADAIAAEQGRELQVLGGYQGTVESADGSSIRLRLHDGGSLTVRYGERVTHDGRMAPLGPPAALWGEAAAAEAALRAWRAERSKSDGVPAYVVLNDAHLRGIALARPADPAALRSCDGIGPTKLERYGDEILAILDQPTA